MKLGDVIDDAARRHIIETGADVAETYEVARAWFTRHKPTIDLWLEPPAVFDVNSMVYRRLTEHLRGYPVYTPTDHRGLLWVIAAGVRDELPARLHYLPDESFEIGVYNFHNYDSETIRAWSRLKIIHNGSEHA